MNFNTGQPTHYSPGMTFTRVHRSANSSETVTGYTVSRLGTHNGCPAVLGRRFLKNRNDWTKTDVFIEYFRAEDGDTFSSQEQPNV